jgi:hypothetical protein
MVSLDEVIQDLIKYHCAALMDADVDPKKVRIVVQILFLLAVTSPSTYIQYLLQLLFLSRYTRRYQFCCTTVYYGFAHGSIHNDSPYSSELIEW